VVYLDTGGGFSAKRIKEFHRGFVTADADSDEVEQHLSLTLDLITVLNVHDIMTLFKVLEELALGLAGDPGVPGDGGLEGNQDVVDIGRDMGLLVVDSLSSLLSPVITRLHHQGYTIMASTASLLRSLAPAHNCAVLYTEPYRERGRWRPGRRVDQTGVGHQVDQHAAQEGVPREGTREGYAGVHGGGDIRPGNGI
jgi:RAD51-like protein 3